jgi:ABC-type multidrug transport system fused ATPase/permease subunit
VFIDDSTIAAIGKHDELVESNARYREVLASMEQSKTLRATESAK